MSEEKEPLVDVPMWDLPVRLFHWAFAVFFFLSWASGQFGNRDLHYQSGMVLLGLVIFRLLWGLVGSPTARFAHFLRWPGAALEHLRRSFGNRLPSYTYGHNAAGGLMVAAVLVLVGLQAVSGMSSTDDILFEGPLYGRWPEWFGSILEKIHEPLSNVLLALVLLHIAVIVIYRFFKRENLVRAMILGRARLPRSIARMAEQSGSTKSAPWWRALACIVIAAAVPATIHLTLMS
ncbi:cytochrome b/b6 domain-containing protein [Dongia deserti]|uniref:cytochrome b/b6 domain-containing protein n=1 Tax=Dongia deserti TaxID=2268030 RepID=UPI0013C4BBF5|nr:cytochrome b/b6 domain-containing protein [Dongia deserti]